MKTNYQMALDNLEGARYADNEACALLLATAQVYATLALADATRDR